MQQKRISATWGIETTTLAPTAYYRADFKYCPFLISKCVYLLIELEGEGGATYCCEGKQAELTVPTVTPTSCLRGRVITGPALGTPPPVFGFIMLTYLCSTFFCGPTGGRAAVCMKWYIFTDDSTFQLCSKKTNPVQN